MAVRLELLERLVRRGVASIATPSISASNWTRGRWNGATNGCNARPCGVFG